MTPDWPKHNEDLMSNYDHQVNKEVESLIKNNKILVDYPGWNFHAQCWFDNEKFHAAIKVYQVEQEILSADTPEELMEIVSLKYGWD